MDKRDSEVSMMEPSKESSAGPSLFVWKWGCCNVSCFLGCACGGKGHATDADELSMLPARQSQAALPGSDTTLPAAAAHRSRNQDADYGNADTKEEVAAKPPKMIHDVSMVGIFSSWKYQKTAVVNPWMDVVDTWPEDFPPLPENMIRLKKVVKLTSASFSFQVVCPQKQWNWRLYPRDFQAVFWGAHVSKAGVMKDGIRDKVIIGVGNNKKGDGMNLHVVGYADDIVTVWMDMPVKKKGKNLELDMSSEEQLAKAGNRAPKVWYVSEDKTDPAIQKAVQLSGGDGHDIEKYRPQLADA